MRVLFTIAVLIAALIAVLGFGVARPNEASAGGRYFHHAHRAGTVWIVDKEPGVTLRRNHDHRFRSHEH
jgi:hypothetical protein